MDLQSLFDYLCCLLRKLRVQVFGKRDCLWEDACVLVNGDVFVNEGKRHYFFQTYLSTDYQDRLI